MSTVIIDTLVSKLGALESQRALELKVNISVNIEYTCEIQIIRLDHLFYTWSKSGSCIKLIGFTCFPFKIPLSLFQNACCLYPWFPGLSHIYHYFSNILLLLRSCLCMICWFQIFFLLLRFAWWRHQMETFPRYWPFVRGIPRSPVNSRHKCQWRGASMFSFICAWTKGLNKQSKSRWFETSSRSLWLHCNVQTWLCPV